MKLAAKLLVCFLVSLIFVSCSANEATTTTSNTEEDYSLLQSNYDELKKEYDLKVQKIDSLEYGYDRLIQLLGESTNDYNSVRSSNSTRVYQIKELLNEIKFYQTEISKNKAVYENNNLDLSIFNIYNENLVEAGDKIAGLQVKNVNVYKYDDEGLNSYELEFSGEFILTGKIVPDGHSGGVIIVISSDEVKNIPHTFAQSQQGMTFKPLNDNMLLNALKDIAVPMSSMDELAQYLIDNSKVIIIKAKFSELRVNFLIGKYVSNTANIVEVMDLKSN